jgi:uncharacterized protein
MRQSDNFSRRGLVARVAAAAAAGFAVFRIGEAAASDEIPRVAYHLSDKEKVQFVLGNIANHIAGMGGPGKVKITLVVNGPALTAFTSREINADVARRLKAAGDAGVELGACGNTLDATKLTVADLVPGFVRIDEGGVVRLAQLQAAGWAYLRP